MRTPAPSLLPAAVTVLTALALGGASGAAYGINRCWLGKDYININNGSETEKLTGTLLCKEDDTGELTRRIDYKQGKETRMVFFHPNGKPKHDESYDANEKKHGVVTDWTESGKVERRETYVHGDQRGPFETFHPGGARARKGYYVVYGDETSVEYNEDGSLRDLLCSKDPKASAIPEDREWCGFKGKPGVVTLYAKKGAPLRRLTHLKGDRTAVLMLDDAGSVAETHEFATAAKPGVKVVRHPNGKLKQETRYLKDGCLDGRQREFDDSGALIRVAWFDRCFMAKEVLYYLNGQKKRLTEKKKEAGPGASGSRVLVHGETYHDTGKPETIGDFVEGEESRSFGFGSFWRYETLTPVGRHRAYYEDGTLEGDVMFKDGKRQGESVNYWPDGTVRYRRVWEQDRMAREKEFDRKGRLLRDEEYFKDGSRKSHAGKKT